jgi:acyl-Coa thioesterase superfamily protein/acyl-CoA thioesterase superfamily protein
MGAEPIFHSAGDGRFVPTRHARGPWDAAALHGGAPAALIVRALEGLGTGLTLARLTIDYLGTVPLEPLTVSATLVRPGRRFAVAEAVVDASGRRRCFARAVLARREPIALPARWQPPPAPPLAPPSAGTSSPFPDQDADGSREGFHLTAFDIRFVAGDYGRGPADVWFRLRRPLVDDVPATPLERLAAAADFGNGVSHVIDFHEWLFVNLDLSIRVLRPPQGDWIALSARSDLRDDGTGVATSTLHDTAGPVGSAAQTLFVAPR